MIIAAIILGVALLIVAGFIPPPGRNIANLCGGLLLALGVILLLLHLVGYPLGAL